MSTPVLNLGASRGQLIQQLGKMSNRHGLIAGATGTGKTVTLQVLAEGFSKLGIPVFAADIKGDLSGLAAAGQSHPKIDERLAHIPLPDYHQQPCPTLFWSIDNDQGHPVRTTISEMGPLLLANLLELNETQSGVIYAAFEIADDEGMLLLDLKDLRSLLLWMGENARQLRNEYGNISSASIGAIQRRLLILEEQGADQFFGEPALQLKDLMHCDFSGRGVISLLDASTLIHRSPRVYAAFLLWLLAELFEQLPEVGDADRPKLVLFFDEAHLLFNDAPKSLLNKVEQVVRLIRSKGIGIYFVTQSPLDIPEDILGQLGMKIEHALRAFTAKDRKTIKAVADSFRANPEFDTQEIVTQLGTGEALISILDNKGAPTPVERVLISPPESQIGPISQETRQTLMQRSPIGNRYNQPVDRESAYELLKQKAAEAAQEQQAELERQAAEKKRQKAERSQQRSVGRKRQSVAEAMVKSAARSIGSQLGRQIIRGVLGSFFGKR
ncbi:helicase HerA-like domain-containing protein [uncultured Desulfuromusa sp.]|uniref:helicase HerA-like domain-containing protein n=1 Tax=uncultured Desulfuromusa sp. TaxID=219183 RepID=UPI002AA64C12|nr:helicase HerA-like domain-containing protein [uncultured Desulfuromusa sp.]